jgi:hypothetical protein
VVTTGLLCVSHLATAGEEDDAFATYQLAVELAEAGDFEEAIVLFDKARQMGAPSIVLYNLGRCYESLGEYEKAVEMYEAYMATPDAEGVDQIRARLEALASRPSAVSLTSQPAGARVVELLGDGTITKVGITPVEFMADPGEHTYRLTLEGREAKEIAIKAEYGKKFVLEIDLAPATESHDEEEPEHAVHPSLGLAFELGGGVAVHASKSPGPRAGADVTLGVGWRFAHGAHTGFAIGLRASIRPYGLEGTDIDTGERFTYPALFATVLAVPSFQIGLHERVAIEASLPVGWAVLRPTREVRPLSRVDLLGGSIDGTALSLLDIGAGLGLRVMIVSGLHVTVELVRVHVLVPLSRWHGDDSVLTDVDFVVRVGFEI